jgi:hypothetical protein
MEREEAAVTTENSVSTESFFVDGLVDGLMDGRNSRFLFLFQYKETKGSDTTVI